MEPRIQYAKTSDGVRIPYWTLGEGTPYMFTMPPPFSSIQHEWEMREFRALFERLAEDCQLIRYDGRGSGLSDRSVRDFSLEAQVRDMQAVTDALEIRRLIVGGVGDAGPAVIAFAAQNPELVAHLIVIGTTVRPQLFKEGVALRAMIDKDWNLFCETLARSSVGWSSGEAGEHMAAFFRECTTPDAAAAAWDAREEFNVTDLLPKVRARTLVVHPRQVRWLSLDQASELAAAIPNAELKVVDAHVGWDVMTELLPTIKEFVGTSEASAKRPVGDGSGSIQTILFTDLVGHTEMMSRLGDAKGREVLREHERITRDVLKAHGGTEVKTMGDGFMASFGSVTKAVECAIELQRAFAEREGEPLSVRVGLNAGEPIEEDGDLFGATVILTSRIAAKAAGGEILVSDNVRSLSAGKGFRFADREEFVAKGFEEPVRVYEVSWRT
jgi:class 3 adenylate cyclase/pimeloyl-ACP methyl ester carboxylesterase